MAFVHIILLFLVITFYVFEFINKRKHLIRMIGALLKNLDSHKFIKRASKPVLWVMGTSVLLAPPLHHTEQLIRLIWEILSPVAA